jgi:iron complex transport system substrate-binding protein
LDELYAKSELFADFKAVKEGNVWCTGKSMFQATDKIAEFIMDLNLMLTDADESEMTFFNKVQ